MEILREDELFFFSQKPAALPLYELLRARILQEIDDAEIQVKKTQISFKRKHLFAAVSFLPVRPAARRPAVYLTLSLSFRERLDSPRVDAAVQVSPNRWTHHITIGSAGEIDEELLSWVLLSAALAGGKSKT